MSIELTRKKFMSMTSDQMWLLRRKKMMSIKHDQICKGMSYVFYGNEFEKGQYICID
jgi:hypothetical protein